MSATLQDARLEEREVALNLLPNGNRQPGGSEHHVRLPWLQIGGESEPRAGHALDQPDDGLLGAAVGQLGVVDGRIDRDRLDAADMVIQPEPQNVDVGVPDECLEVDLREARPADRVIREPSDRFEGGPQLALARDGPCGRRAPVHLGHDAAAHVS